MALTATATKQTWQSVEKILGMKNPVIVVVSPHKPPLLCWVQGVLQLKRRLSLYVFFNTRRYTSVQGFCFWLFVMGCKEFRSSMTQLFCVCRMPKLYPWSVVIYAANGFISGLDPQQSLKGERWVCQGVSHKEYSQSVDDL